MAKRGPKPGGKRGGRKPGQRNLATREVKDIALPYAPEAIDTLVRIMRKSKSDQSKVAACRELLDRAYGKAAQPIQAELTRNIIIELVRFGPTLDHPPQDALPAPTGDP